MELRIARMSCAKCQRNLKHLIYIGKWWTSCYWFNLFPVVHRFQPGKEDAFAAFLKMRPVAPACFVGCFFGVFFFQSQSRFSANLYLVFQARASHSRQNVADRVEARAWFFFWVMWSWGMVIPYLQVKIHQGGYLNLWVSFPCQVFRVGWSFCFHSDWLWNNMYQPVRPEIYVWRLTWWKTTFRGSQVEYLLPNQHDVLNTTTVGALWFC